MQKHIPINKKVEIKERYITKIEFIKKTCHLCGSQGLRTNATFFCEHCQYTYNAVYFD